MLGIPDFWIYSAYILCLLSTLVCVVYGAMNWNRGAADEARQIDEETKWEAAGDKGE